MSLRVSLEKQFMEKCKDTGNQDIAEQLLDIFEKNKDKMSIDDMFDTMKEIKETLEEDEQIINEELYEKIKGSNNDRREIIHHNCFYSKDITNEHITRVIEIFRKVDKLVKKHKRKYREIFTEPN